MGVMNNIKTIFLLGLLTALFLFIGSFWGKNGLFIGLVFALVMNIGSYWFSDKMILAMYRAKKSDRNELNRIVEEVAELSNIPMPKVYIIPSEAPNAFATGRSPKHAAVAVTNGILKLLSKDELKGVIAHEMAHIKNRDTLIQAVAATIASVISYAAIFARFSSDDDRNALGILVMAFIAPIAATIIQLAISRSREYLADEKGAKNIHNPESLASALEKIEGSSLRMMMGSQTTSSLFIINPFKGMWKLFATHPPTYERVKKLREMI